MSEKDYTEPESLKYFMATLMGMALALASLGVGIIHSLSGVLDPTLSAAWAWAIGAGTGLYAVPWVKEAFK